jgi:hypothetical protein
VEQVVEQDDTCHFGGIGGFVNIVLSQIYGVLKIPGGEVPPGNRLQFDKFLTWLQNLLIKVDNAAGRKTERHDPAELGGQKFADEHLGAKPIALQFDNIYFSVVRPEKLRRGNPYSHSAEMLDGGKHSISLPVVILATEKTRQNIIPGLFDIYFILRIVVFKPRRV